jgi:hypothetical protein
MRIGILGVCVALLLIPITETARAAPPPPPLAELPQTMRLEYRMTPGVRCPPDGESLLRLSVSNQMHHEPFDAQATARLVTTFRQTGAGTVGHADLFDEDGVVLWSREVIPIPTCADAIETLALAIAFKLEPPAGPPHAPPAPACTCCTCCACAPAPSPSPASPPLPLPLPLPLKEPPAKGAPAGAIHPPMPIEPPERRVRAGAGVALGFGVAPLPAVGVTLDLGLRWPFFSASVEGRAYLPTPLPVEGSDRTLVASRFTAALVPCGHFRALFLCTPISMGPQPVTEDASGSEGTTTYAALGGRFGGELSLPHGIVLRLSADVLHATRRPRVRRNEASWDVPEVEGALNAGFLTYF